MTNILYLHSHDTGRCISPYGYKVNTPNLQKFATESVTFRQCFCANPTCSPSRACLLSGEYAHSNGMLGLAHRGFEMNDYSKHIVNTLKQYGYHSALLGIQHIASGGRVKEIGYDEVIDLKSINQSRAINDLAPFADEFFAQKRNKPFFLSLGCFETHRKFPEYDDNNDPRWVKPPAILPDTPQTRIDTARFNTMAEIYDTGVGKVLASLEKHQLTENTLVIITTDHGIAFPGMKCTLTDQGLGVLLMMRGPDGFTGGKVIDGMVSHVDVFPTICEYLGIEPPKRLQGTSFMPLVSGEKSSIRDEVFAEVNAHAAYEPMRCVRTERYKYIKRFLQKHTTPAIPNCDKGESRTYWLEHDWQNQELEREELYDLVFDPQERNNLAQTPKMKDVLKDMRQRLQCWMEDTDDPILTYGCPPMPDSARLDNIDGDSATGSGDIITDDFRRKNEIPEV